MRIAGIRGRQRMLHLYAVEHLVGEEPRTIMTRQRQRPRQHGPLLAGEEHTSIVDGERVGPGAHVQSVLGPQHTFRVGHVREDFTRRAIDENQRTLKIGAPRRENLLARQCRGFREIGTRLHPVDRRLCGNRYRRKQQCRRTRRHPHQAAAQQALFRIDAHSRPRRAL